MITQPPPFKRTSPISGVVSSATDVAGDFVELAELQVRLANSDLRAMAHRATIPMILLIVGGAVAVAALPVAALGLASWVDQKTTLTAWSSQLIVGGGLFASAALSISAAILGIRSAIGKLNPTVAELAKNVAWLKGVIRHGTSSTGS